LEQLTDAEWDHGINRTSKTELLLRADTVARLFLRAGDRIEFPSSDRRTIIGISSVGRYKQVSIDSAASSSDVGDAMLRIVRQ
jgi:hypothetical protein